MPTAAPVLDTKQQAALAELAKYLRPALQGRKAAEDVVKWGETQFYVPETGSPIRLEPFQKAILRMAFDRVFATRMGCASGFQTYVYSTVKKSGKTTIASLVARWIAETWGNHNEIFCMANDLEQARGRVYAKLLQSIELDPNFDKSKRTLPGRWRIIERDALELGNGSVVRAVSSDYKGEAGSNPTATFWSELWGYTSESSKRMWAELTPVPTRERSIRWIETYAGYENESELLLENWEMLTKYGRRITRADLEGSGYEWPFPEDYEKDLPLWVNPQARMFGYIDQMEIARRMPWQIQDYYSAQAALLRPNDFSRLHLNLWTSSISEFIPIEWWDRLRAGAPASSHASLPPLDADEPIVLAADASVTGDCSALAAVSRDPLKNENLALRWAQIWTPSPEHPMDYSVSLKPAIIDACQRYNVIEITYDPYQLHHLMNEIRQEGWAWCKPFDQGTPRMLADKQLYDVIRDKRITHDGDYTVREHIRNCAAKTPKDEDTKLRIIKRAPAAKIDAAVALSMAAFECLRLNL